MYTSSPCSKKANLMDNYRPISILSADRAASVHLQLYACLQCHKELSLLQCGFGKCHCKEWAGMCFDEEIRRSIDQGRLTGAVFLDLRKCLTLKSSCVKCGTLQCWMVNLNGLESTYRTTSKLWNFLGVLCC